MEFGVLSIFQNYGDRRDDGDVMRSELEIALAADALGFDSYWATEHHFFGYSMCPDNVQWLAQVGASTKQIKLGTGAIIMPWNDPYRIAAKMALLDQQTGGRALLGFGRGLSRKEYERFGISMDEARERFDRGTRLVVDALNRGYYEDDSGRPRADLRPKPTASFGNRLYSIGVSPESASQAAVLGAKLMVLAQQPWEVFREMALEPYQEKWRSLHDSEPPTPFCGQLVFCHEDGERARELGERYVKEYFMTVAEHYEIGGDHFKDTKGYEFYNNAAEFIQAAGLETMADMYAGVNTFGTPDEIVEKIHAQREILGCESDVLAIVGYGSMSPEEAQHSLQLLGSKVLPRLR